MFFVEGRKPEGGAMGISHKPLSDRFPKMMTLPFFRALTSYQENMAIQSLMHSWPTEMRIPVFRSSKTYACCVDWEREVAIGMDAW